ncbi:MAG: PrsW family glutamic-type intramembrane protease [Eubacteriales bacterium]|jgi:RsiW-degrading membrane proteinase PrsW (M82 family)
MFLLPIFVAPAMWMILIYACLAVIPAIVLMRYVYNQDRVEHEPAGLLTQLIFLGALAGFLSMILESIGSAIITPPENLAAPAVSDYFIYYFVVVGCVEEGTKYLLMGVRTWHDPAFNFRFDGIVYAVFTSLGFAAMENILYVFQYGASVIVSRALLSIPGHMAFSVLFGVFYGRAKRASDMGRTGTCVIDIIIGYFLASLLHGVYDTCASISSTTSMLVFLAVIVVNYLLCFLVVKNEARHDEPA